MTLGQKLRQTRLSKGLSQSQVAGGCVTRNMLSQIENDQASPSMRTLPPSSENGDMLLAQASDTYVLDPEAIEHLDDVFGVLATAEPVVLGVFIAAVLTAVGVGCASGRRTFGTVLLCAGLGTIAIFAILGIWAAIDFEGLFAVFHSLFFAQGSWVFSADSLLITMYPEPFWIGMGAIWLATTIAVSAVSTIAGFALRHA